MTIEEQIMKLQTYKMFEGEDTVYVERDDVLKLLEQESCENAISRQAVLDALDKGKYSNTFCEEHNIDWSINLGMAHIVVNELKSVTPQPKTGHWIMPVQDDGMSEPIFYQVRCSECGFDLDPQTWHMELHQYGADKYCPNCGARMEVEE